MKARRPAFLALLLACLPWAAPFAGAQSDEPEPPTLLETGTVTAAVGERLLSLPFSRTPVK